MGENYFIKVTVISTDVELYIRGEHIVSVSKGTDGRTYITTIESEEPIAVNETVEKVMLQIQHTLDFATYEH